MELLGDARRQLAERLRQAREVRGLSQEEVARELGLGRPSISHIENGHRRVEALELAQLARLYGRPLSYFTADEFDKLDQLRRATAGLTDQERDEVLRFAEELKQHRRSE